ncbi:MAG: hypothetical protein MUF15_03460 [Acidobacteria bacterium]|jgi:hypothetical protein|nr:hypothetical protein [Acidobacteriota bacterium]
MKGIRITIIIIISITITITGALASLPLNASELGNKNLKNIQYVIPAVQLNGVVYGEGYEDPAEENIVEINLDEALAKLKSTGILFNKENIRILYKQMEAQLQKAELKVLKMKKYADEKTTLIPILTAGVDVISIQGNTGLHIIVVHMTLSKWFSNWSGGARILAPVYTWSGKQITTAQTAELPKTIETAVLQLTGEFLQELKEANQEEKKPAPEKANEPVVKQKPSKKARSKS